MEATIYIHAYVHTIYVCMYVCNFEKGDLFVTQKMTDKAKFEMTTTTSCQIGLIE